MSLIKRGFSRLAFHTINVFIRPIELLSARKYMKLYTPMLKLYGVQFTGVPRYISSRVRFDDFALVSMGERTVLSANVILLTHDYSITTALSANQQLPATDIAIRRPIEIGDNVFIGMNCILLPGTVVGDNVIVGAGSVLRGNVESDSIVLGNPAVKVGSLTNDPAKWAKRSQGLFARSDAK